MLKITLVIHSLSCGGAERVISIMANYWANQDKQVTLLTFTDENSVPFYKLDPKVDHKSLNLAQKSENIIAAIFNNISRISKLRAAINQSKPDVVISFLNQTNVQTLLATQGLDIPVIVAEREVTLNSVLGKAWRIIRRWTYLSAEAIVLQTKAAVDYVPAQWRKTTCIIPNPVIIPPSTLETNEPLLKPKSLITMGRLESQKGFDILLKAFAKLSSMHPQWTLSILGEGSLREQLIDLRDELGLTEKVYLPGKKSNPYDYLKQADIFVLSSRYEGFPNALCEAMASGLPVVSTSCLCGPTEIITNQVDGILVPTEDVGSLSTALEGLMNSADERARFGAKATKILDRFGLNSVMNAWDSLIEETLS